MGVSICVALLMTGCAVPQSSAGPTSGPASASTQPSASPGSASVVANSSQVAGSTSPTAWQGFGPEVNGAPALDTAHPDAATWLLRMDPSRLRFRFIPGFKVPEGGPVRAVDLSPATWVPWMLASFNGAFKLVDHAGGYFYDGRTVVPLRTGLASLVVGLDGSMRVVVWSRRDTTTGLLAVRQNLRPLVLDGRSTTRASDTLLTWGRPLRGHLHTNRSALAMLRDGSLVYVYVQNGTPDQLATESIRAGAVTAIALDMNSGWPGALLYRHSGGLVTASLLSPVMHQHLDGYSRQNQKDFIAVLDLPAH